MQGRSDSVAAVEHLVRAYYHALEQGETLEGFYATDHEAGALGPVVKIGSGSGEFFTGYGGVAAAVRHVTATLLENALESRGPLTVRQSGEVAWFVDRVWWSGVAGSQHFASLTRWTGVCLCTPRGWKFLQLHVSEEVGEG
jgi:hypothetical protein